MCRYSLPKMLLAALALSLVTFTASAAPDFQAASCGEVTAWVDANQDHLPQTLADFESVPDGFQPGVFKALPADVRSELWNDFLQSYVEAQPGLEKDVIAGVHSFETYMADPQAFADIDDAARQTLSNLLASFTLYLVDPVTDLAMGDQMQVTVDNCNCNRNSDWMCMQMFCVPQQTGCGPSTNDPCNGLFGD